MIVNVIDEEMALVTLRGWYSDVVGLPVPRIKMNVPEVIDFT